MNRRRGETSTWWCETERTFVFLPFVKEGTLVTPAAPALIEVSARFRFEFLALRKATTVAVPQFLAHWLKLVVMQERANFASNAAPFQEVQARERRASGDACTSSTGSDVDGQVQRSNRVLAAIVATSVPLNDSANVQTRQLSQRVLSPRLFVREENAGVSDTAMNDLQSLQVIFQAVANQDIVAEHETPQLFLNLC